MPNITNIEQAKAILDLGRSLVVKSDVAHVLVVSEGPITPTSENCARILDLEFKKIWGAKELARTVKPHVMAVILMRAPDDEDLRMLATDIAKKAATSITVVRSAGRDVEDFATHLRTAEPGIIVRTCHF